MIASWDTVVVGVAVAAAIAWAVRGMLRAARRRRICSSCASSGGCPLVDGGAGRPVSSECVTPELLPHDVPRS